MVRKKIISILMISLFFLLTGCSSEQYVPVGDFSFTVYKCYANGTPKSDNPIYASSETDLYSKIVKSDLITNFQENNEKAEYILRIWDADHYGIFTIYDNGKVTGNQDLFYNYVFHISKENYKQIVSEFERN